MKKYLGWLMQDGLLVQVYFGICGIIFLALGGFCILGSYKIWTEDQQIIFSVAVLIFGLLIACLASLWLSVSVLHPNTKFARAGLKVPFDGVDILLLIIIPAFFCFCCGNNNRFKNNWDQRIPNYFL